MSQLTFLVVDDVPTIRLILRRAIAVGAPQAVVWFAGTVGEAREILTNRPINVVITDYHLTDGTGFEVIKAAHTAGQTVPVILISADSTIASSARLAGAYAFLAKPFDMPQLLQLLRQVCSEAN